MELIGTKRAAEILGVTPGRLNQAVWNGRIATPERGPGGIFIWNEADLRRAARVLLRRDYDEVVSENGGRNAG